jgi:hypothetical protein
MKKSSIRSITLSLHGFLPGASTSSRIFRVPTIPMFPCAKAKSKRHELVTDR